MLETVNPDEVYNFGAQSHVEVSFDIPEYRGGRRDRDLAGDRGGARPCLAWRPPVRYYQAGSSEMFGDAPPPQSERTAFYPRGPYGVSKVAAHWFAIKYREAHGLVICNGIPRRGETFVKRKVIRAVGRISQGLQDKLYLGNLEAQRDWGSPGDYVEAMWLILQQQKPDHFIIATGEVHSVRDFVELAFAAADLDWRRHVEIRSTR
jgi:GDPmannose 4,6-dehydratase